MNYNQRVASRQSACPDEGEFDFVVNQVELFFSITGLYVQLEGTSHVTWTIFYTMSTVHSTNICMRSQTSHTPTNTRAFLLIQPFLMTNCSINVSVTL